MRIFQLTMLFLYVFTAANSQSVSIIPAPVKLTTHQGSYMVNTKTKIITSVKDQALAGFINDYLMEYYGYKLQVSHNLNEKGIRLHNQVLSGELGKGYKMLVDKNGITISGTGAGLFHGVTTLLQLFPADKKKQNFPVAHLTIEDYPRFEYRGMHLDVGRHFFPVSFIKKYLDYMAMHKFNNFHWHLTEDQGWRIEIKKYPKLTEVGAWRNGTIIGRYPGTDNDSIRYGGFYTQEEVKEIVRYAAERYINVIPEIELPGHSSAAIAAYPELSCFPEKPSFEYFTKEGVWAGPRTGKQVQQTFGVLDDVYCAGKENTFQFVENVLEEVLQLFPSKVIHIGGDESPKTNWVKCAHCQRRIKENGLKDEHELQSYFIKRMEKYLNDKGRTLLGWDEILEGGLAPNAMVMSWRGEEGGIEAAKHGNDVIMTPSSHVYLDYSQTEHEDSVVIGGYLTVQKVYSFEPIPQALTAAEAKHIKGAQANLWTEYIKNTKKLEYMLFPRMSALSEVVWSPKEKRSWESFEPRMINQFKLYELWGANYSKAFFDLKTAIEPAPDNNGVLWSLTTKSDMPIRYAAGDNNFVAYRQPIHVTGNTTVSAYLGETQPQSKVFNQTFQFNKATGKAITLKEKSSPNYPGDGAFTLVNGVQNTNGLGKSKEFLGFNGTNCEAIIDLGKLTDLNQFQAHTYESKGSWIYLPAQVEFLISSDGINYTSIGAVKNATRKEKSGNYIFEMNKPGTKARYVKVIMENHGQIESGEGAGNRAWLFTDEIVLN